MRKHSGVSRLQHTINSDPTTSYPQKEGLIQYISTTTWDKSTANRAVPLNGVGWWSALCPGGSLYLEKLRRNSQVILSIDFATNREAKPSVERCFVDIWICEYHPGQKKDTSRRKETERGLNLWCLKTLLAPAPSVRQPQNGISDHFAEYHPGQSTSANGPTQLGPIQKQTQDEFLQFLPSPHEAVALPSAIVAENRRNPKGDGGKGTGKKMSRQFATNVTTIYDMSRQFATFYDNFRLFISLS